MGAQSKPIGLLGARPSSSSSSFRLRSGSLNSLRLRRIFDLFDHNHDGLITVPELCRALQRLGLDTDVSELGVTVEPYIKPGRDGLEYDDFEELHRCLGDAFFAAEDDEMKQEEGASDDDLTEAFKVFDEDGDGYISARELQTVLNKLGLPEGGEIDRVRQMICSVDENRDGQVDFLEFKHMMQTVLVP